MTSIVLTVCEECGITKEEFFGPSRKAHLTQARRIAIDRLVEAGLSYRGVAAAIKRNISSVQYWLHPQYRERRTKYFIEYNAKHRGPHVRKLAQEQRKHLVDVYLSQGIQAAKPVAIEYGINPQTISHYARMIGVEGKRGRPKEIDV